MLQATSGTSVATYKVMEPHTIRPSDNFEFEATE